MISSSPIHRATLFQSGMLPPELGADRPSSPAGLENARCVVFGGGGFIGTNLCRRLRHKVASLKSFGRRQAFPKALDGVEWLQGDFNDPAAVATAIEGANVVVHLVNANTPSSANVDKAADLRANVGSTLNLMEACRAERIERIVFVSSGGTIYGIPTQIPTPEDAPCWPITAYGISKLATERYLHLYEYLYGVSYRILRVSNPFGPYQIASKNQGAVAAFVRKTLARDVLEVWGDGSIRRDYIYIDDVIDALEASIVGSGEGRVFNIGSGISHSLLQIIAAIETATGIKAQVKFKEARSLDVPVSELDITRARDQMGWNPQIALSEGIVRTADWMRTAF